MKRIPQFLAVLLVGLLLGAFWNSAATRIAEEEIQRDQERERASVLREMDGRRAATDAAQGAADASVAPPPIPEAAAGLATGSAASSYENAGEGVVVVAAPDRAHNVPRSHWNVLDETHRAWFSRMASDLGARDSTETLLRVRRLARAGTARLSDDALARRARVSAQLLRLLSPGACAAVIANIDGLYAFEEMGFPMNHPSMIEALHLTVEMAWLEHTDSSQPVRLEAKLLEETLSRAFDAMSPAEAESVGRIMRNPAAHPPVEACEFGLLFFDLIETLPSPWGTRLARALVPDPI